MKTPGIKDRTAAFVAERLEQVRGAVLTFEDFRADLNRYDPSLKARTAWARFGADGRVSLEGWRVRGE